MKTTTVIDKDDKKTTAITMINLDDNEDKIIKMMILIIKIMIKLLLLQ